VINEMIRNSPPECWPPGLGNVDAVPGDRNFSASRRMSQLALDGLPPAGPAAKAPEAVQVRSCSPPISRWDDSDPAVQKPLLHRAGWKTVHREAFGTERRSSTPRPAAGSRAPAAAEVKSLLFDMRGFAALLRLRRDRGREEGRGACSTRPPRRWRKTGRVDHSNRRSYQIYPCASTLRHSIDPTASGISTRLRASTGDAALF